MAIRTAPWALAIAASATALPAAPALAQSKQLGAAGEWAVSRYPESCMAMRGRAHELVSIGQLRDDETGGFALSTRALDPYVGAGKDRITLSIEGKVIAMHNADVSASPNGGPPRLFTAFASSALWPTLLDQPFKAEFSIDGKRVWSDTVTVPPAMGTLFLDCVTGAVS